MSEVIGRDALLSAFDRLFDRAAQRLNINCTSEERDRAKQGFARRFDHALNLANVAGLPVTDGLMRQMEDAIDDVSPADVVGYLASGPLVQQVQEMARSISVRAAKHRVLEHYMSRADDQYGGN